MGPAVTGPTGAEVRATAADAARQARGVLAALADPDDELTATAAMRNRIEGATVALERVSAQAIQSPTIASSLRCKPGNAAVGRRDV